MKATGQLLKEERERQGMTADEVALLIKVNTKIVIAIEEGDTENLPAKTFLRGFVQSYASMLKMDKDLIMDSFQEEMGSTKPKSAIRDQKQRESELANSSGPTGDNPAPILIRVFIGIIILAIGTLIYFLAKTVEKYEKEARTEPAINVAAIDNQDADQEKDSANSNEVDLRDQVKATPRPTPAALNAPKVTEENSQETENEKPKEETPKPTPTPEPAREEAKNEEEQEEEKPKINRPNYKHEVILEAFDAIDIEVKKGDGSVQNFRMKTDEVRVLKAKESIQIRISNAGAVNVIYNGKDVGVPGSIGEARELVYPKN